MTLARSTLLAAGILLTISSGPHAHATTHQTQNARELAPTSESRAALEAKYRRTHRQMNLFGAAARVARRIQAQVHDALPNDVTEALALAFGNHWVRLQKIQSDLLSLNHDPPGGKPRSEKSHGDPPPLVSHDLGHGSGSATSMLQQVLPIRPVPVDKGKPEAIWQAANLGAKGFEAALRLRRMAIEEFLGGKVHTEPRHDAIAEWMAAHHVMWASSRLSEADLEAFRTAGFQGMARSVSEGARLLHEVYANSELPLATKALQSAQAHLQVEANRLSAAEHDGLFAIAGSSVADALWATPGEGMMGDHFWVGPLELYAPLDLTSSKLPFALPLHGALYWLSQLATSLGPPRFPD